MIESKYLIVITSTNRRVAEINRQHHGEVEEAKRYQQSLGEEGELGLWLHQNINRPYSARVNSILRKGKYTWQIKAFLLVEINNPTCTLYMLNIFGF